MPPPKLIGPFTQILTLAGMPAKGPLKDDALQIIQQGGVLVEGAVIREVGDFDRLLRQHKGKSMQVEEVEPGQVLLPGFIDAHTHMCFAGSRAGDYALKVAGSSYQDILAAGGGIHDTVAKTRAASKEELVRLLRQRCDRHLGEGVTTAEVKSGYGLSVEQELKMLRAIARVGAEHLLDLVPTCLAAHVKPKEFASEEAYLEVLLQELLPTLKDQGLTERIDVFVEKGAFPPEIARPFLQQAKALGFSLTLHADQFSTGGSALAVETGALSADHLEASGEAEIELLARSAVVAVVLPGASLGLGMPFAPARKLLDAGACLAIATDWNPGSAPMGDLLLQAAVLGAAQKLSTAETFAGITYRAARTLALPDRGTVAAGGKADFISFPTADYREILYQQGKLKPIRVWKNGSSVPPPLPKAV
ncbi:imidazolonepropionase [soil metagenome]